MARWIDPLPWEPEGLGLRHCSAAAQLCGNSDLPCFAWSVLSSLDSCGREVTLGIWLSLGSAPPCCWGHLSAPLYMVPTSPGGLTDSPTPFPPPTPQCWELPLN